MSRAIFSVLFVTVLAACTSPLGGEAYMEPPDARADKVTARVGEPVEVTVMGGFGAREAYHLEEYVQPGVSLGACFWYEPDKTATGGLCGVEGGEQPLPAGISTVDGTDFAKDFGNIVVKRGELRKIEHTFTFTSDQPGEVAVLPGYLFTYDADIDPGYEPGGLSIIRITFE